MGHLCWRQNGVGKCRQIFLSCAYIYQLHFVFNISDSILFWFYSIHICIHTSTQAKSLVGCEIRCSYRKELEINSRRWMSSETEAVLWSSQVCPKLRLQLTAQGMGRIGLGKELEWTEKHSYLPHYLHHTGGRSSLASEAGIRPHWWGGAWKSEVLFGTILWPFSMPLLCMSESMTLHLS